MNLAQVLFDSHQLLLEVHDDFLWKSRKKRKKKSTAIRIGGKRLALVMERGFQSLNRAKAGRRLQLVNLDGIGFERGERGRGNEIKKRRSN